jgi:hypothetical protein
MMAPSDLRLRRGAAASSSTISATAAATTAVVAYSTRAKPGATVSALLF